MGPPKSISSSTVPTMSVPLDLGPMWALTTSPGLGMRCLLAPLLGSLGTVVEHWAACAAPGVLLVEHRRQHLAGSEPLLDAAADKALNPLSRVQDHLVERERGIGRRLALEHLAVGFEFTSGGEA